MSSKAYKEYYERNRAEICAKMRLRNAEARRIKKEEAFQSQDGIEAWREENREKYYRAKESKITAQLKLWVEDKDVSDTFKAFLRQCLWEHKHKLTLDFVRTLGALSIANAYKSAENSPAPTADGDIHQTYGREEEGEGEEIQDQREENRDSYGY